MSQNLLSFLSVAAFALPKKQNMKQAPVPDRVIFILFAYCFDTKDVSLPVTTTIN